MLASENLFWQNTFIKLSLWDSDCTMLARSVLASQSILRMAPIVSQLHMFNGQCPACQFHFSPVPEENKGIKLVQSVFLASALNIIKNFNMKQIRQLAAVFYGLKMARKREMLVIQDARVAFSEEGVFQLRTEGDKKIHTEWGGQGTDLQERAGGSGYGGYSNQIH